MEDYRSKEVIKRLYVDERLTIDEIAKRLYIVPQTVRYYMKKHGIKSRGHDEKVFNVGGRMMTYKQMAEVSGLSVTLLKSRVRRGWTVEELLGPRQQRGGYHRRLQRS